MRNHITLAITGQGVNPENLPIDELIAYLENYTTAIRSSHKPRKGKRTAQIDDDIISLTAIEPGSVRLGIAIPLAFVQAVAIVSQAVSHQSYDLLPAKAADALVRIETQVNERGHSLRIIPAAEMNIPEAVIQPTQQQNEPDALLQEYGTIYGRIIGVRGEVKPTAEVKTTSGDRIYVHMTSSLAQSIALHLYQWVILHGVCTWNASDWTLADMQADRFEPWEATPVADGFAELREIASNHWEGIDPQEFVDKLRGRR